jgi:hypothetical protein
LQLLGLYLQYVFIIGIASVAFSLIVDITFGDYFGLYHYINPQASVIYMVGSAIFIYPLINIIYTLFLPESLNRLFIYTTIWIGAMLVFEYLSVYFRTIVFTGWRPFPWSLIIYIATFLWINVFYKYIEKNCTLGRA